MRPLVKGDTDRPGCSGRFAGLMFVYCVGMGVLGAWLVSLIAKVLP